MSLAADLVNYASRAMFAVSQSAQLAFVHAARNDKTLLEALVQREDLTPQTWSALWSITSAAQDRYRLANRPLTDSCISLALTDKRVSVLAAVALRNPSHALFTALPSALVTGPLADVVTSSPLAPLELRLAASNHASLLAKLTFATHESTIKDSSILNWLLTSTQSQFTAPLRQQMDLLLSMRPSLLDTLVGQVEWVDQVICSSVQIKSKHIPPLVLSTRMNPFAQIALMANPVCDPEEVFALILKVVDGNVSDEVQRMRLLRSDRPMVAFPFTEIPSSSLPWLIRRASVSEKRPIGRPIEALALANTEASVLFNLELMEVFHAAYHNPVFSEIGRQGLLALGGQIPTYESPEVETLSSHESISTEALQRIARFTHPTLLLAHAVRSMGENLQAWETFLSLLPEFDGTTAELLNASHAL
jgi:hypothetical protein